MKRKIVSGKRIDQTALVSVIIPLYNNQRFIEKCIKSLQAQTYKNCEIIVIDDGSTDNSLSIANAISKEDTRVKVFKKENEGVSSARNLGIEKAQGDYICFIDSDDYVANYFVEGLLTAIKITGADISCIQYKSVGEKQKWQFRKSFNPESFPIEDYDTVSGMKQLFSGKRVRMNIWNKMYPISFFKGDNALKYDEKLKHCEDVVFLYQAFVRSKKIVHVPIPAYAYTKRRGSLVHSKVSANKLTSLTAVRQTAEWCEKELPEAHTQVAGWQALVNVEMLSYMVYDRYYDYEKFNDIVKTFKLKMKYVPKGERHYLHRRLLAPIAGTLLKGVYKIMFCQRLKRDKKNKEK